MRLGWTVRPPRHQACTVSSAQKSQFAKTASFPDSHCKDPCRQRSRVFGTWKGQHVAVSCCWKTLSCCVLHLPARGLLENVSFGYPATPASGLNIPVDRTRECAAPRPPERFHHFFTGFREFFSCMASTRTLARRRDAIATAVWVRSRRLRGCRGVSAERCGWLD